jgi:hypothetical protein
MRSSFCWQLPVLLLAGCAAGAQVDSSNQSAQSDQSGQANQHAQSPGSPPGGNPAPPAASQAPTTPTTTKQEITVTAPRPGQPLPALPADEFTDCMTRIGLDTLERGNLRDFAIQASICEQQLNMEKHVVIEACINRSGNTAPTARPVA